MQENRPSGIIVHDDQQKQIHLTIKQVKEYMDQKTKECVFLKMKLQEVVTENQKLKQRLDASCNES
mgnify:CR=1 FL=1